MYKENCVQNKNVEYTKWGTTVTWVYLLIWRYNKIMLKWFFNQGLVVWRLISDKPGLKCYLGFLFLQKQELNWICLLSLLHQPWVNLT